VIEARHHAERERALRSLESAREKFNQFNAFQRHILVHSSKKILRSDTARAT
jgi:hypothetical protein